MSFAIVQDIEGHSAGPSASPVTGTLGSSATPGNAILLIALGIGATGQTWSAVGDNKSNTYSKLFTQVEEYGSGTNYGVTDVWLAPITTGGTGLQVTATPSAAVDTSIVAVEISFAGSLPTLVGTQVTNKGVSGTMACGNITVSGNCAVFMSGSDLATGTKTIGGGYTAIPTDPGAALTGLVAYLLNTSTNPATPVTTYSSGGSWQMVGWALEENPNPTYTLTGPTGGAVSAASTNFTVTPSATIASDTITFSDGGAGGTFSPTSLTFTSSSAAQTFTYTPASSGAKTLTLTSGHSYTVTNSPKTYTVTAAYTLTGPTGGQTGVASTNFTLTPSGTITSDTITFSAGAGGGTFAPTSLTFTSSSAAQTFTYTPASVGTKTLTLTSGDSYTITGSPATYTSSSAVGYTLTGPLFGLISVASTNFTLTPGGTVSSDTITMNDGGGGGTFAPTSLTFTSSAVAQTFTYTPSATAGAKSLNLTSGDGGPITGEPATYTAYATATSYTFSGSNSAIVGVTSGNITLTPNGLVASDTVTLSDGGAGGTFTPTSLTWTNSSAAKTFTYENGTVGTVTITGGSSSGLAFSPLTWTFAVLANTVISYESFVSGLPTGLASSAVITPQIWNGTALSNPGTATAGTPVETSTPGSYWVQVTYHSTDVPTGSFPSVHWSVGGQLVDDPTPLCAPGVNINLAQPVPTTTPIQTVGGALNAALAGAAGGVTWIETSYVVTNTDGSPFRTFVTNTSAPSDGVSPTSRI